MAAMIERAQWHQLRVSPKTVWSFIELTDSDGRIGVGEATRGQREPRMREALALYEGRVLGHAPAAVDLDPLRASAQSLPEFAVISALDQAVSDLEAQQRGISVAELLGPVLRRKIAAYANINRGIVARTPDGFAAQARLAIADGFKAIKIAPFDEVTLYGKGNDDSSTWNIEPGLARIAAVRDAAGPDIELMVDCHWRLNRVAAEAVLTATAPQKLYWLECPVPEKPELFATIRHLREKANALDVKLAGCEEMSMLAGFQPFLDAGAYDAMMPDAKYVGGLKEMLRVGDALKARGVSFSPHNPSGPVCHAASLHVCAVSPAFTRLEVQYAETPLFDAIVGGVLPKAVGGAFALPSTPGMGVRLDPGLAAKLATDDGPAKHAS